MIFPEEARNKTAGAGKGTGIRTAQQDQDKAPPCASQELPVDSALSFPFWIPVVPPNYFSASSFSPPIYFPSATVIEHISHCLTSLRCSHSLNRGPNYQGWWAVTASLFPTEFWAPLRTLLTLSPLNLQARFSCAWNALPLGSSCNL